MGVQPAAPAQMDSPGRGVRPMTGPRLGDLRRPFAWIRESVRAVGAWSTLLYTLRRLCAIARLPVRIHSYRLVVQPLAPSPRLPARRAARFTSRLLPPGDPDLLLLPADRAVLNRRFALGAECLALYREGVLVATFWFVVGPYLEDEVRCRFVPLPAGRCSWDFDVYVDPNHRMTGAFAALWDAADAELARRGVVASLSRISAFNAASLRGHASLGAAPVGRADFLTLGPLQVMRTQGRPWLDIGWGARSVPSLRVDAGALAAGAARRRVPDAAGQVPAEGALRGHPEG